VPVVRPLAGHVGDKPKCQYDDRGGNEERGHRLSVNPFTPPSAHQVSVG
jgi:hypothetical protein